MCVVQLEIQQIHLVLKSRIFMYEHESLADDIKRQLGSIIHTVQEGE